MYFHYLENNTPIYFRKSNPVSFRVLLSFQISFDTFELDNLQKWSRSGKAYRLPANRSMNIEICEENLQKLRLLRCTCETARFRIKSFKWDWFQVKWSVRHPGTVFRKTGPQCCCLISMHGSLIMSLFIRLAVKKAFSH